MPGRSGQDVPDGGSGEEAHGGDTVKAVAGGAHADHNLEVLAGLLGADTDSVDLDTLFDAVQAVAGEGQDSPGGAGQTAGVTDGATDDPEGSPVRIIDDGTSGSIYDKLVDSGLGDFDGLKLDGLIDIFGTDA